MRAASAIAVLAVWLLAAPPAQACAVCFSGNDATRVAFILTTAFLSVLPLAMVGAFVWWIRQRMRQLDEAARQSSPPREPAGSGAPPGV